MEKISIITPCFNAEKYIEETYNSIKAQTHSNWEWVIVDDCSTDRSIKIIDAIRLKDNRVKLFKNMQNSGAAVTRNSSLDNATGSFVAFLDIDDLWVPTKLEQQVNSMLKNNIDFSYHNYKLVDASGKLLKSQSCPLRMTSIDLLKFNPFATSSIMIRKNILDQKAIRFKVHLRRRQDYLFWFDVLNELSHGFLIQGELSSYRIFGSDSLSANKKKMATIQWKLYREEFNLNIFASAYYFCHYAIHGLRKYFLN